jgi:hypothetical protein
MKKKTGLGTSDRPPKKTPTRSRTAKVETIEPLQPLCGDRQSAESDAAVVACNDYLRMGIGRSLAKLSERYQNATDTPPTKRLDTLKEWSAAYGWQLRAKAYDAIAEDDKNVIRRSVMEEGFAVDYRRVNALNNLAAFLLGEIEETNDKGVHHNVWVPDVKMIGSGDLQETVDIERFNAPLIEQFRKTLDDLAKETGGRVRKNEHTGRDGKPIETTHNQVHVYIPDNGRGDQAAEGAADSVPE